MIRKHLTTPFTRRMTSLRFFSSLPQKDSLAIISGETDLVDILLQFLSVLPASSSSTKPIPPITLDFVRPISDSPSFTDTLPVDLPSTFSRLSNPSLVKEYYTVTNLESDS